MKEDAGDIYILKAGTTGQEIKSRTGMKKPVYLKQKGWSGERNKIQHKREQYLDFHDGSRPLVFVLTKYLSNVKKFGGVMNTKLEAIYTQGWRRKGRSHRKIVHRN